jgi:hypothetical protein
VDRLIDDIVWLEDIVDNAVIVGLLARTLVDAPAAIDDKLESHVSKLCGLGEARGGGNRVAEPVATDIPCTGCASWAARRSS